MFIICDGQVKIFGVFDGHWNKGHQVSSFVQSKMIYYLSHEKKKFFSQANLIEVEDIKIEKKVKKAFKYAQTELKSQYKEFMIEKNKEKNREKKIEH